MPTPTPWFRLLLNSPKRLTLPFILGACRYPRGEIRGYPENREEARFVFDEMLSYRTEGYHDHAVQLLKCHQLKMPVFSLARKKLYRIGGIPLPRTAKYTEALVFLSEELAAEFGEEVDNVFDSLFDIAEIPLADGHFSYCPDRKVWLPFQEEDHRLIDKALGKGDPASDV